MQLPDPNDAPMDALLRRSWHPVAIADSVSHEPTAVTLLGEKLVLFRASDSTVTAFHDVCVHRGAALSLGWRDGDCLVCPFHGWRYDGSGQAVGIPSQPDRPIPAKAALTACHTREHVGLIWVALDDPVAPLPEFPEHDDPAFRSIVCPPYDWDCHALRRLENFLDFAHFAWVHPGTLGDPEHPEVPPHEVWSEDDEIRIRQPRPEPRNDDVKTGDLSEEAEFTDDGRVMTVMHYRAYPPLAAQLRQELPDGREYVVFIAPSPVDEHTTRTFWHVTRNYALDQPDADFIQFQVDVVAQDRPIVESQRPERIPPEITAELHVGDDKVSLAWRRLLAELGQRALAADRPRVV